MAARKGLELLRHLLLKDAAKESGKRSGIAQIGNVTRDIAEKKFQAFVLGARKQGVDLDNYTEEQFKYIIQLNKPKIPRVISADSPEGKGITQALFGKEGKVIEGNFGKPFAKEIDLRQKMVDDAIDNSSPGFAGDIKYDAQLVAEDLAEKMYRKEFYDLSQKQQSDVYGKAYDGLSKQRFKNKKKPEVDIEDRAIEDFVDDAGGVNPDDPRGIDDFIPDPEDMATGGRAGFKMGRRAFLKLMGGAAAGIGALKAGALKMFGKETAKNIPQVVTTPPVAGKPAWFDSVVNKVIAKGDDVTKQFAYKDRMQVNTKQISPTEEVTVYRDLDDGSVRINYGAKMRIDETKPYEKGNIGRASNDPDQVDLIVREGEVIEPVIEGKYKGTVGRKTQSSFEASEAEPRSVGGPEDADIEFDGERIVNNVDDLMQDVSTLEEFGTGKKLIGDKAAKAQKKREAYERFSQDQMEQAEYLETKYGPGP
jgi:hypothetical protein